MSQGQNNPDTGKELFNARKFNDAAMHFESRIKSGEQEEWMYNLLGHSYLYLGRYEKANVIFTGMKALFPRSPRSYAGLGRVCDAQRKFAEGQMILQEGIKSFPESLDIKRGLLLAMHRLRDYDEALVLMQEIRDDIGEDRLNRDLGLLHVFGLIYEQVDLIEESETVFLQIKKTFPNHPLGYMALANLYLRSGSIMEALREWKYTREKFPERVDVLRSYGSLLSTLGLHKEASNLILSDTVLSENPILWIDILRYLERQLDYEKYAACFRKLLYEYPEVEVNPYIRSIQSTHNEITWVKKDCELSENEQLPVRVFLLASVLSLNQRRWIESLDYADQFEHHPKFIEEWKSDVLYLRFRSYLALGRFEEMDVMLNAFPVDQIPTHILIQWSINYGHRYLKNPSLDKIRILEERAIKGDDINGGFIHQIEKFRGIDAAVDFSRKYLKKGASLQFYYLHHALLKGYEALKGALEIQDVDYGGTLLLDMLGKAKIMGSWDSAILLLEKAKEIRKSNEAAVITWFNILVEAKAIEKLLETKINNRESGLREMERYLTQIRNVMSEEFSKLDERPFSFRAFLTMGQNPGITKDFEGIDFSGLEYIERNFKRVYLNTYTHFSEALTVAREIRNRIIGGIPTSMIRLGDGEGVLLGSLHPSNDDSKIDIRKFQRLWWGEEILDDSDLQVLVADLYQAIMGADMVGVPGWNRIIRDLHSFRGRPRNEGGRGILHTHNAIRKVAQQHTKSLTSKWITSAHLPMDLNYWNLFDYIFKGLKSCTIISSHSGLPAILSERFGFEEVQVIRLPGEYKYLSDREKKNYRPPFPLRHKEILQSLDGKTGGLFLVAAGILGKMYCQRIKEMGGIALDIGALVDYWHGRKTRSMKLNSSSVCDPFQENKSNRVSPRLWTTLSDSFSKLFAPKSDVFVLSVFRYSSVKVRYVVADAIVRDQRYMQAEYETMYYVSRIEKPGMKAYCIVERAPDKGHQIVLASHLKSGVKTIYKFFAYPSQHAESQIQRLGVNQIDGVGENQQAGFYPLKDSHYHKGIQVEVNAAYRDRLSTPRVSIVMTYYQRKEQLDYTLKTMGWSRFDADLVELIIVDDCSTGQHSLSEWILDQQIAIKLIVLGPEYKRDKNYCNPAIPYNIGFSEVKGDSVIIQNPEVCHIGDVIQYTVDHLRDSDYLVFTCAAMPNDDLNREIRTLYSSHDLNVSIQMVRRSLRELSLDAENSPAFWHSHSVCQAAAFHFLTAIPAIHLFSLGGFLEEFSFGFCADDNEFIFRIRNRLRLQIRFVDYNSAPFGIHQWHPKFLYFQRNLDFLHYRNRRLLSRLVSAE